MNIAIAGINGFLGSSITDYLSKDFKITPIESYLLRNNDYDKLKEIISCCDFIINFSGFPINKPWSKKNIEKIIHSRYNTTILLFDIIKNINKQFLGYINASAIGIYDSVNRHTELSYYYNNNFLGEIIKKWESAIFTIPHNIKHHYIVRIGNVLDMNNGILPKLLLFKKLNCLFIPGNGKQYFSFIHINDFTRAIHYLVKHFPNSGIYNLVAKEPCTYNELIDYISVRFNIKYQIKIPKFFLQLFLNKRHILLSEGQYVIPKRLIDDDFIFAHPDISSAISNLLYK